ncbi:phosphoribosylamine-glycine ligase, putative [Ricinus communis]|uniref:Phosphoribosylglycinamide formyltransferase, chloroplastic n=1 Tax=Ricinus communis TaxID=3988 RepID=B9SSR2_RICCO|nr:phosphoribosylamine-glycine ligase, putative [Ricinus communis]|eukprot:XP_002529031.1 phosphoribosylglycinamide formyltransferase, chloroplastic [Ricinus communis]
MEAKALLSSLSTNSALPSFQKNSLLSYDCFSYHSSTVNFHNYLWFKTLQSTSPQGIKLKPLQCVNSKERLETIVFENKEYKKPDIKKKKLAVFVSGGGSNFKSIHQACLQGLVFGDVVAVVTNKQDCGGAEYARDKEIPVVLFPRTKDEPHGLSPSDLVAALRELEVDFILLAGYLKLIPAELSRAYPRCIFNIHPSLLPAFGGKGYYGMKVHKAVIASGARYSGPTIHFVDEHYDTGRILAQRVVPVLADDTAEELAARVLREEHRLYVEVTMALCEERIIWREDGVPLIQSRENPSEYS